MLSVTLKWLSPFVWVSVAAVNYMYMYTSDIGLAYVRLRQGAIIDQTQAGLQQSRRLPFVVKVTPGCAKETFHSKTSASIQQINLSSDGNASPRGVGCLSDPTRGPITQSSGVSLSPPCTCVVPRYNEQPWSTRTRSPPIEGVSATDKTASPP